MLRCLHGEKVPAPASVTMVSPDADSYGEPETANLISSRDLSPCFICNISFLCLHNTLHQGITFPHLSVLPDLDVRSFYHL